jgi:predicted nucleotidyltransferase
VQELALFGSALTSDFGEESDIDLLVTFQPGARVGFLTLARMQRELAQILGRKVDLVPKGGLKPIIRESVLANARVLYAA